MRFSRKRYAIRRPPKAGLACCLRLTRRLAYDRTEIVVRAAIRDIVTLRPPLDHQVAATRGRRRSCARASFRWVFCRDPLMSCRSYLPFPNVRGFVRRFRCSLSVARLSAWSASQALPTARPTMPSADSYATVGSPLDFPSSDMGTVAQTSPGKFDRLRRTFAGSTALALVDLDFAIHCPLVQPRMPHIRFLSVRSRLCFALTSDAFARPCAGW
jgi:hypothetical protein